MLTLEPRTKRLANLAFVLMWISIFAGCNLAAQRQNRIGRQAFDTGQVAQAINRFQRALNLNPNNSDAYYNLCLLYTSDAADE